MDIMAKHLIILNVLPCIFNIVFFISKLYCYYLELLKIICILVMDYSQIEISRIV